jgi:hypothetical protein
MFLLVAFCQLQIFVWRLLRFLDESMEQNHSTLLVYVEKHASNSVLSQARSHFIDALAERLANRHPDGPAELYSLEVLSEVLPVLG